MESGTKVSDYCDLFLALTEPRTQTDLNEALMATCLVLFPDHNFWLYDYREIDHTHCKLVDSDQNEYRSLLPAEVVENISHTEHADRIRFTRKGEYSYYGFSILHSLSGVLITNWPEDDPLLHDVLIKLVSVYSNQRFFMFSALNDALTGLSNRQAFDQQISSLLLEKSEIKRRSSDADSETWCFALLDIDHFKQINDDYGHLFGDEVLLIFSQLMQKTFRDGDLLFRYGGEEFAVALKDVSLASAIQVLERFRMVIANAEFPQLGQVTVSIGVTCIEDGLSTPLLIDRADQALYFAKEHGRNQVHSFEALAGSGYVQISKGREGDIELF